MFTAAGTLAGVSFGAFVHLKAEHAGASFLRASGLVDRQPQVAKRVLRERDAQWAKLAIARALLAEAYNQ